MGRENLEKGRGEGRGKGKGEGGGREGIGGRRVKVNCINGQRHCQLDSVRLLLPPLPAFLLLLWR